MLAIATGVADGDSRFLPLYRTFATGSGPSSIAVGDLDLDGIPDLVVANREAATVSVLLAQGGGSFAGKVDYQTQGAWWVAIDDLNRDGWPDVAVATGEHDITLLLGRGQGAFRVVTGLPTGATSVCVAAGDLDGDGKPDLVSANFADSTVSVLLGRGDGTFAGKTDHVTGAGPFSIAIADLNADGIRDLAVANNAGGTVSVLMGSGDGSFAERKDYATSAGPWSVAIGDLNSDGKMDLAVANYWGDGLSLLYGNGDGTFTGATNQFPAGGMSSVTIDDLDTDGRMDLVLVEGPGILSLRGNGDGTFARYTQHATGFGPLAVAIGDLNGDGRKDLAVVNRGDSTVSILPGSGDGRFVGREDYPLGSGAIALGDLDRDGKTDMAQADGDGIAVMLGRGGGMFGSTVDSPSGFTARSIAVGDVNRDGKPDLVTTGEATVVWLGRGDGTFAAGWNGGTLLSVAIAVTDMNADGKPDLVVPEYGNGSITVLLGDGDGNFTWPPAGQVPWVGARSVAIGYLDGDAHPDVAVASGDNGVAICLGGGDGTLALGTVLSKGRDTRACVIADLNGDGRSDLVIANGKYATVSVLLARADGAFEAPVDYATGAATNSIAASDVTGDGRVDLVVGGSDLSLLEGHGDGTFGPRTMYPVYSPQVAVGDFDQDGRPDIAAATGHGSPDFVEVLLNTGIDDAVAVPPPVYPATISLRSYPNPSRGGVTIEFTLPEARRVEIEVFDIAGRSLASLARGDTFGGGPHRLRWDLTAGDGRPVPSGLYLVRMRAGEESRVGRVVKIE